MGKSQLTGDSTHFNMVPYEEKDEKKKKNATLMIFHHYHKQQHGKMVVLFFFFTLPKPSLFYGIYICLFVCF